MPPAYVIEQAVVGLGHDRVDAAGLFVAGQRHHPLQQRICDPRRVQGAGQQDGCLDLAQFLDLGRAHQLAVAVPDKDRGGHPLMQHVSVVRKNGGHAGANVRASDQGGMTHAHAGHIGDGVARPGRQRANDDAQVAGAAPSAGWRAAARWRAHGSMTSIDAIAPTLPSMLISRS